MSKCRISKSNSAITLAELDNFCSSEIIPIFEEIYDNEEYYSEGSINPTKMRTAVIAAIQSLGSKYHTNDHKYIESAIDLMIKDDLYSFFSEIMPKQYISTILKSKESIETLSSKIFTDTILDDEENTLGAIDYFLNNAYGSAIQAKEELKRKMNNIVIDSFIINRKAGTVVSSISEANLEIIKRKKALLQEILDYLKLAIPTDPIFIEDMQTLALDLFINIYKSTISLHLSVGLLSNSDLLDLYLKSKTSLDTRIRKESEIKLNAYGAWLALQHFDDFIKMTLGDTIIINPSSESRYSYSTKGTNVNTTYRKNENIDLKLEINLLTQMLIMTSPMYKFGLNEPLQNVYLQFSDFCYITAKIKDLEFSQLAGNLMLNQLLLDPIYTEDEKSFMKDQSLRLVISYVRLNPQKYLPLVYKILASSNNGVYNIKSLTNFNKLDQNLIYTIYKNLYEETYNDSDKWHSLYSIQLKHPDAKNYYSAVSSVADCLSSVNFVLYIMEDGIIKLITLREAAVGKTLKEIEKIINTKNYLLHGELNKEIEPIFTNETWTGISISITNESRNRLYIHVKNKGQKIIISNNKNPDIESPTFDISGFEESINKFLDKVLGLNFQQNPKLVEAYKLLVKSVNDDGTYQYYVDMLTLAGHVSLHRTYSLFLENNGSTRSEKIAAIQEFFDSETTSEKFNDLFFTIDMVPKSRYPIVKNIAQALSITRNINSSRQVKDGSNAMLSSQTLSRLLGNLSTQFESQINIYNKINQLKAEIIEENKLEYKNTEKIKQLEAQLNSLYLEVNLPQSSQTAAAARFSLITNSQLFQGILKSEEIKTLTGTKKLNKFTTAEAVHSSFLHNFVLGHCSKKVLPINSEFGDGVIGLLPSVNSDKSTVSIAKFNLNANCSLYNKKFLDLSAKELKGVMQSEIGLYYNTMVNNIKSDFDKLQEFLQSKIIINVDSNFKELNEYVDKYNNENPYKLITATLVLLNAVNEYNETHSQNPIRLIDQIHYISYGKHVKFNEVITELQTRFSDINKINNFFNIKNTEILKSLIDADFSISLYGDKNLDNLPEIQYLRNNYSDWINNAGLMILGRIDINGKKYDISSYEDLLNISKVIQTHIATKSGRLFSTKSFVYDDILSYPHLLNEFGTVTLHPMLEKYNLMDYLFTQEFLYSTVGSHVAHPSKADKSSLASVEQIKRDEFFVSSKGLKTKLVFDEIQSDRETPVGAQLQRIGILNGDQDQILVNIPLLLQKFNEKAWMYPAKLSDDTRAQALPEDTFTTFEEWLTFILEHESAHRDNLKEQKETKGEYETRINNIALEALNKLRYDNLLADEAARFYAQHKRNVSFTASMNQFQLNQINGIPTYYNIAVIDDIIEPVFTIDGKVDKAKPFDGATFVNPFIMYLENNSLNEARAGIDKKQFVHFYDELTGTGGIIKTAGFAITNDRLRNSLFYRKMMKNMTDRIWLNPDGTHYIGNILETFKKETYDFGKFYFQRENKYYECTLEKVNGDNLYIRREYQVNQFGEYEHDTDGLMIYKETLLTINSNYKIWDAFGGMNSCLLQNGKLKLSETSMEMTTEAIIHTGELKQSAYDSLNLLKKDLSAEHVFQPLKHSDIHYIPTIGAVKQGAANINPNTSYTQDGALNFYRIRMANAGILLDKEHHADDAKLSLMTLVISAACAMGYNPKQAEALYKALYNLTITNIRKFKDGLLEMFANPDSKKFENTIAECMIRNMMNSTAQDGDMLRAIARDLIEQARKGKDIQFASSSISYSDPAVFEKLITNLSVIMTKAGIKATMNGILSVLCPTQNIVKTYSFIKDEKRYNLTLSQLEQLYGNTYDNIIDDIQNSLPTITDFLNFDFTQIEIGRKYRVILKNGEPIIFNVKYPHDVRTLANGEEIIGYQKFKDLITSGNILSLLEYIKDGKELGSINYFFKGTDIQNITNNYQVWDIDFILDLFKIVSSKLSESEQLVLYRTLIEKYDSLDTFNKLKNQEIAKYNTVNISLKLELRLLKLYAKQIQLKILFALSKNNNKQEINITVNGGHPISIDPNSIITKPYQLVMPKTFLKEFGLDEFANLNEIIQNPNYFYDKMRDSFETRVLDDDHYDIELKRTDGKHIYIKDKRGLPGNWDRDLQEVPIRKEIDKLGKVWRVDLETGKNMYLLSSENDKIYKIPGTDIEIILTETKLDTFSGIPFYLNNFKYQTIHISDSVEDIDLDLEHTANRLSFDNIVELVHRSKNSTAKLWYGLITGTLNTAITQEKQVKNSDKLSLNKLLNHLDSLSEKFKSLLLNEARKTHSSLLKSLDIIAARIPAQNQQSFMPMEVVAWDNPNINTAYVSVMQFFLQGSDLDIDAVSLLTHAFDENGQFYTWSPEFDLTSIDALNESLKIPFPTGEELKIIDYSITGEAIVNQKPLFTDNKHVKFLQDNDESNPEWKKHYIALLEELEQNNNTIYFNNRVADDFIDNLILRINEHNTFLNDLDDKTIEGAIKNRVVTMLYSITSDAANWLESHTGVDVATDPIKELASKSSVSKTQRTLTPGNVINKFQAIEEASIGKDDIAICATGLKAFFAATQFCNSYLNNIVGNTNILELDSISSIIKFKPVTIGGKTFKTLANIRIDDLNKLNPDLEIASILRTKGFDDDASIIMSALLSLSTDNAKELVLAKINAGTSMMGLYLYGTAIGMDFEVLNQIISSPLGLTVAKLLNGNEFTNLISKTSIVSALQYLYNGPSFSDFSKFDFYEEGLSSFSTFLISFKSICGKYSDDIKEALKDNNFNSGAITKHNVGKLISLLQLKNPNLCESIMIETQKSIEDLLSQKQEKNEHYKAAVYQLLNYINTYRNQVNTLANLIYYTEYGESNIVEDFKKLALGADEFKRLGKLLRLNQEIKTKPDELLNWVFDFENIINDRNNVIFKIKNLENGSISNSNKQPLDFLEFAKTFILYPQGVNEAGYDVYWKTKVDEYEEYKTCVNPLRILTNVPHYRGYLESMILAYEGDYKQSIKFRAIKNIGSLFISDNKVTNSKERSDVIKGVKRLVDDYINNAYLESRDTIKLPKNEKNCNVRIIGLNESYPNNSSKTEIKLGNLYGNLTFVNFFEDVFIPKLKENFKDNIFVLNLTDVVITDSINREISIAKSLSINMMPIEQNERDLFNAYKADFTKISGERLTIGRKDYFISEMFYYYNLIKFKGQSGPNSLIHIFEDVMSSEVLKSHREFIHKLDVEYDFSISQDDNSKHLLLDNYESYLAPRTSPFRASSNLIRYYDKEIGKSVLLDKIIDDQDLNYEYNDFNYLDNESNYIDEEYGYSDNTSSYGKYTERIVLRGLDAPTKLVFTNNMTIKYDTITILDGQETKQYVLEDIQISDGILIGFKCNGLPISGYNQDIIITKLDGVTLEMTLDTTRIKAIIQNKQC